MGGMQVTATASAALLCLGFLATCCIAWPTNTAFRRSNNYYPPQYLGEEEFGFGVPDNQWEIAQEPAASPYDIPENYYVDADELFEPREREPESDSDTQWSDIQALTNLMELYDAADAPVEPESWGQIVREKPETELEELKHLQKHVEPPVLGKVNTKEAGPAAHVTPATPTVAPAPAAAAAASASKVPVALAPLPHKPQITQHHQGQKEIPLLRPPNKPKTVEPLPVIAQRSTDVERKPSPYDTLRKYLSIEDALKKEAEKRRVSAGGNRQKKRSYVADEDSLTGQLNNLKKSVA